MATKKKPEYRYRIKQTIRDLMEQCGGKSSHGDKISVQLAKGMFMVSFRDRGGIKEGWWMKWFPYTKRAVEILKKQISY